VCLLLAFAASSSSAGEIEKAAESLRVLRASTGAFQCDLDITSKNVFVQRDPNRVYETNSAMSALVDGPRFNIQVARESVWFPDSVSPAQIKLRVEDYVFDGERQMFHDKDQNTGTIEASPDPPHFNPAAMWLTSIGQPIENLLELPGARILDDANSTIEGALIVETPNEQQRAGGVVHRFWLDPSRLYFPVRQEYGTFDENGDYFVSYALDVDEIGETSSGVFFPMHCVQKLFMKSDGKPFCFTERDVTFNKFEAAVEIDNTSFTLDYPRDAYIEDKIANIRYRPEVISTDAVTEIDRMIEESVDTSDQTDSDSDTSDATAESPESIPEDIPRTRSIPLLAIGVTVLLLIGAAIAVRATKQNRTG
jgi:hypothetical protein